MCFRLDDCDSARDWLAQHEMSADGECVVRRVLQNNGRSKAFINGYSATLPQLRALCEQLVDIHGQHEHQSLQRPQVQRQLLDAFLGDTGLIEDVRRKHAALQELAQRLQAARSGSREREQRIDLLGLYCEELNQLDLAQGEFESLKNTSASPTRVHCSTTLASCYSGCMMKTSIIFSRHWPPVNSNCANCSISIVTCRPATN